MEDFAKECDVGDVKGETATPTTQRPELVRDESSRFADEASRNSTNQVQTFDSRFRDFQYPLSSFKTVTLQGFKTSARELAKQANFLLTSSPCA